MRRLLALIMLLVFLVPAGGAVAQEDSAENDLGLPVEAMREALRDENDSRLDLLRRLAEAEVRQALDDLGTIDRVANDPDSLFVLERWGFFVRSFALDLDDIGETLPLVPLYRELGPSRQTSLIQIAPNLPGLHVAMRQTGLTLADLLRMSPPERREALREAVLKVQTSTQAAIATYWAAQVRRDVDSAQLLLELLNAEIASRASDADDGSEPLDGGEAAGEQAEPSGFAGVWDSSYAPPLILTQSGSSVTGSYNDGQSQMILEITGDRTLEGYWIGTDARKQCETAKAGSIYWGEIELTFREDWSGYTGKWGYCLDDVPDIFWGYWQGDYIRALDAGEE